MTNPTPHGQVPEALPAIQRFEVVDCIDDKHVPAVIPKPHGPWVREALAAPAAVEWPSDSEIDALVTSIGPTEGIRKDSRDLSMSKLRMLVRRALATWGQVKEAPPAQGDALSKAKELLCMKP